MNNLDITFEFQQSFDDCIEIAMLARDLARMANYEDVPAADQIQTRINDLLFKNLTEVKRRGNH